MNKFKAFWLKIWNYLKYIFTHPRELFFPFIIAELIFWSPVWVCALLAVFISPWWWTAVGAVIAFWAGPFTPAVPLQIGLIAALERLFNKKNKNKKENKDNGK